MRRQHRLGRYFLGPPGYASRWPAGLLSFSAASLPECKVYQSKAMKDTGGFQKKLDDDDDNSFFEILNISHTFIDINYFIKIIVESHNFDIFTRSFSSKLENCCNPGTCPGPGSFSNSSCPVALSSCCQFRFPGLAQQLFLWRPSDLR